MAARSTNGPLRVFATREEGFEKAWGKICRRRVDSVEDVEEVVSAIIERVRRRGDKELLACIEEFDGVRLDRVEVSPSEWDARCGTPRWRTYLPSLPGLRRTTRV